MARPHHLTPDAGAVRSQGFSTTTLLMYAGQS
jgi:hypothetical protein